MSVFDKERPLVSIGVPVRNGGKEIEEAIQSLVRQTEKNIEIIISDNGSSDGSENYLQGISKTDSRIRYYRQEPELRSYDNFRFVLAKAKAPFFMWAAHDDTRTIDYIEITMKALNANKNAILAFGKLNIITPFDPEGAVKEFDFQTCGLGTIARLTKVSQIQCYNIYGLWRTDLVRKLPYAYCAWWPDLPMMMSAAILGEFVYAPNTTFNYFEIIKTNINRVENQDYKSKFRLTAEVMKLISATYKSCSGVGGWWLGAYGSLLVTYKQLVNIPGFVYRSLFVPQKK